jgi:hypothetical protein
LLPRATHTAIWKARYVQQSGYYAVAWHSQIIADTWPASLYEFGTHPYPASNSAVNSEGQSLSGSGGAGTVHYYEIAGLGASDFLASPGGTAVLVVKDGGWITQARTSEIAGSVLRHKFWPNVAIPNKFIQQDVSLASFNAITPTNPAFQFGGSPWRSNHPSATMNDETSGGVLRGFKLFNTALSISDIAVEAADETNTPQTAAGTASVWYMNVNPTPSDVTDKSGKGHHPSWVGSARPSLWSGP